MKIIFVGKYYIVEPLGLMLLAGVAKEVGADVRVVLVKDFDFAPLYDAITAFQPDLVCFSIWTGYHVPTFAACDRVRQSGIRVVIGGPHATYFTEDCAKHSDWTIKGEGFRPLRKLLGGELPPGIHHDKELMADGFPVPDRSVVYDAYPELGASPIKSIMASVGCPFHCSYCYAPTWNEMHGGFSLHCRSIDDLVREGRMIRDRWGASMIYFQDDVFGFDMKWLEAFCRRWPVEVGIPWHCQIRLELTQKEVGLRRLKMFAAGGCTGITVAIESGNAFLREFVLLRPMTDALILEGCQRIHDAGLTLRTEQILAVPFSDIETDLQTLQLNCRIQPEMAWTSILAPYGGTKMGQIANRLGFYAGNNDDLSETFFDRSVLSHYRDGLKVLEPIVRREQLGPRDNPLLRMKVDRCLYDRDDGKICVYLDGDPKATLVARLTPRSAEDNADYSDRTVTLQRLFNWFARVPYGWKLAADFVALPANERHWSQLERMTKTHLIREGYGRQLMEWTQAASVMRGANPLYYLFIPGGEALARRMHETSAYLTAPAFFDHLGRETRHHLFRTALYKLDAHTPAIAESLVTA